MPARKRLRIGEIRRPYKRRRTYDRTSLAVRKIRRELGIELKFFDSARGALSISATGTLVGGEVDPATEDCLNAVQIGDGEESRDGRKITMKSIEINGVVEFAVQENQTTGSESNIIMIALVLDTQTNNAQLRSQDVFINHGAIASFAPLVFPNLQFKKRFRILQTKYITMQDPNMGSTGANFDQNGKIVHFMMKRSFNIETIFSDSAGTVADTVDNSLHMIAFTNSLNLVCQIRYNSRLRFVG